MNVQIIKSSLFVLLSIFVSAGVQGVESWESEKLALEVTMQQRIDEVLSKIISRQEYVIVVQVEPWASRREINPKHESTEDAFFLPGVPARRNFDGSTEVMRDLVDNLNKPKEEAFQQFVRRVAATLVLDRDLDEEKVERARELTRQILGLNPSRGDTLEIQRTVFNKSPMPFIDNSGISKFQRGLQSYWLIISLALIVFCITVFLLFVFGPLRGFLNRFVQVLPTLKPLPQNDTGRNSRLSAFESQILPALMAQSYGMVPPSGGSQPGLSGSLMIENPNKQTMPFSFIREPHLANLGTLLARENAEKAAVVLGYLPPEWISKVISKFEPEFQSEITEHLATTRQLLPEQVEDVEQDLKRRLDYMIGGPDRITAIYESLDPENQRKMLNNLKATRPELANELRGRTFLFEDLEKLDVKVLRVIFKEVELQTLINCLKGGTASFKNKILESISPGKAEIVREELEFNDGPGGLSSEEARKKVSLLARRLEREGQIRLPRSESAVPQSRYGASLKSTLKIDIDGVSESSDLLEPEVVDIEENQVNIESRIQEFMSRRPKDKERFPTGENTVDIEDDYSKEK